MTQSETNPIIVNATPKKDQLDSSLHQVLLAGGAIAVGLGAAKIGVILNALALVSGPISMAVGGLVSVGAFVYGQIRIRKLSEKAAAMAKELPNEIAQGK